MSAPGGGSANVPAEPPGCARAGADPADRLVEEASLNYLHSRRQLFYDGWLLFLSPGKAKRARSVTSLFGSTLPLAEKVAFCERTYERFGLPTLFRMTPFSQPEGLDETLGELGFERFDTTLVQVLDLDEPPAPVEMGDVGFDAPLPEVFVEVVGAMRGSPAAQRVAHLERLAQSPLHVVPLVARKDQRTLAAGLVCVAGPHAGLFDIVTDAASRRNGYATGLVARLLAKAWERGARRAFLQVEATNAAALALYRRFGFATRYTYHYRARPETFR